VLTQEDEDVLPHQSDSRKRSRAEPKKHLRKKTDQQDDEQDDEPAVKKPRSKAQIKKGICFTCQNRFYRAHLIPGHLDHLTESERELQEIREFEARLRERDERHTKKKVISSTHMCPLATTWHCRQALPLPAKLQKKKQQNDVRYKTKRRTILCQSCVGNQE